MDDSGNAVDSHDIQSSVPAARMAQILAHHPPEEVRTTIGVELIQALAANHFGDACFWVLVFGHWAKAPPSERVRTEIEAYLRAFSP